MSFLNDRNIPETAFCRFREYLPVPGPLNGLRILLVEDEYLIAMDVETICLEQGAASVSIVGRSAELEDDTLLQEIDAAIIDVMLAGVPTFPFAGRLQQEGIPFIFASAHGQSEYISTHFPDIKLVEKPYAGSDLVEALAEAREASRPQSAGDVIT